MKEKWYLTAVVGPDGAGKSYILANDIKTDSMHAIPISRRLSKDGGKLFLIFREFIMAMERCYTYIKIRIKKPMFLDRCVIDALTYSRFWSIHQCRKKFGKPIPIIERIGRIGTRRLARYPDEVIQLWPGPGREKVKRSEKVYFSHEDVQLLNAIYNTILIEKGYEIEFEIPYEFGIKKVWRKKDGRKQKGRYI